MALGRTFVPYRSNSLIEAAKLNYVDPRAWLADGSPAPRTSSPKHEGADVLLRRMLCDSGIDPST